MNRIDISSCLGTTADTVSRKLAEFEDIGWIKQIAQRD
ncbi:helix-turn-helix domain-containing protein [Bacillus sp. JJ1532]